MTTCFPKLCCVLLLLLLPAAESILGFNNTAEIKCIDRKRQALLNFKHDLVDAHDMLSTWRDDDNSRDCCKWKGIQCDPQTGHVTVLRLRGGSDTQYLSGAVNITSLFPLQNIQRLDLSKNEFIKSHIPELMGSLTNLRYLNLSYSDFGGNIPTQLGSLTHLLSLDLSHNYLLRGDIPYQLGSLTNLRYLDLSHNKLDGKIPCQLGNMSQLRYLGLTRNSFSGALPFQVGNLPYLQTLGLGGDFDVKPKDAHWLSNLSSLTHLAIDGLHNPDWLHMIHYPKLGELRLVNCSLSDTHIQSLFYSPSNFSNSLTILDLSSNMLTSSTFQLLSNFPSLVILDLSYNKMTSSVFQGIFNFSSKLQNLYLRNCSLRDDSFLMSAISITNSSSSLASLDLSSNLLKSSSIFYWLFNSTTNLRKLKLNDNMLEGPIPDGFGKVMNSLEVLDLYGNKLQGEIPSFFGNMCTLQSLDLSNNKLSGNISSFIQNSSWCNKQVFQSLFLSDNQITGILPMSIGLLSEMEYLYLDGNCLEGDVTESHLSKFSKLRFLSLSDNSLSLKIVPNWVPPFQIIILELRSCKLGPSFPSWLQTQRSLFYLDISENRLNGSVPKWFWNNLHNVERLYMSQNNLSGAIPNNISLKLFNRPSIFLNSNNFEGKIPQFLLQASDLRLSDNKFSDLFSFICDQRTDGMATLDLSNNQLKGLLPDCWKSVHQLFFLDLSNNKLTGKIPVSMGSLVELEVLVLRNNNLTGELASTLKNCSNLIMLDVAENMFSGPIPSWIGENMQQLIILNMRGNHFSGHFPIQLCYLKRIQFLDLSRNMLSKGIPSCLKNLTAMTEKNINTSDTLNRIYSMNITYFEMYGVYSEKNYTLSISLMWKGVEQGFKNPELQLKIIDISRILFFLKLFDKTLIS
ncbi:hypothetical protein LR48_Vigan10g123300 [Vigna angularis]|uniref:Uncharacterized protein n=1 Tax=Phaseolus angularis TaxID=3914 RepID=A0A0L9VJW3_PHAAN|nr:hypothetical protein LR48_Vigan10g123300 [Vigna angularis]